MRIKGDSSKQELDREAYKGDMETFLNRKPREYIDHNRKNESVTLDEIRVLQQGILVERVKETEKKTDLSLLIQKGGTKSIVDLKMPSEVMKEQNKNRDVNKEQDQKIEEDLENLKKSDFMMEMGNQELEDQDMGNNSTFYMLSLLKKRGIVGKEKVNGLYNDVSKKDRYESFLKAEKKKYTDDTGNKFYDKFLDKQHGLKDSEEVLGFDRERFLRKKKPIRLEYTDKKGYKLTKKEAFNEMCHKFHGTKPSVTKNEKIRKKREKLRQEQTKTNSNALPLMFKTAKKITNKSFINLTKDLN